MTEEEVKQRVEITKQVFCALLTIIKEGGSYRHLIYDLLEFDFEDEVYGELISGLAITNFINGNVLEGGGDYNDRENA